MGSQSEFPVANSASAESRLLLSTRDVPPTKALIWLKISRQSRLLNSRQRMLDMYELCGSLLKSLKPRHWTDGIDFEQYQKQQERDSGRKLDVADLLFDTLGISEPWLVDISFVIHILIFLLTQLLFRSFSIFPGTVRPRCTTMPWTIWPALVVLWGVCWMFWPPRPDEQSLHEGTLHSEIRNSHQDLGFWSQWELDPFQIDFGNGQPMQQHLDRLEDHSNHSYRPTESPWTFPSAEHHFMTGDALLDAPRTETKFGTTYPAATLQSAELRQQANLLMEPYDDNREFNKGLLLPGDEIWGSLPIDMGQEFLVAPAISTASASRANVPTVQLVSKENPNLSNQLVFATEESVKCNDSDRSAPTARGNKNQDKKTKDHDRRFLCDVEGCNLVFPRAYELNRHKSAVHGEGQRFRCPEPGCKFSRQGSKGPFGRKDKLRDHINNVHPDLDLASIPGLQHSSYPAAHPAADKQNAEVEPKPRGLTIAQFRKRRRISSAENSSSEAQEALDTEVKRLRIMMEDLREENRQMKDRHGREVEDLKDQNRWLRKMFEESMKRTGGNIESPDPLDS